MPVYGYRVRVFVPMSKDDDGPGTVVVVDLQAYHASDAWLQALIAVEGQYGLCRIGHAQARVLGVMPRPQGPGIQVMTMYEEDDSSPADKNGRSD